MISPFWFFLLTGAVFRITRFITTDDLTEPFREKVLTRTGDASNWYKLISCNWCASIYIATLVFAEHLTINIVPWYVHAALTASAITGMIGNFDE